MINEPVLSWNLLVTVIGLPTLGWFIKHLIENKERSDEKALAEWQKGATERNRELRDKISDMQRCLDEIIRTQNNKVDVTDCQRYSREKWDMINHHKHDTEGKVTVV